MQDLIQRLARDLVDRGLNCAFGITGSGPSLSLITELENAGARYYPVSHEACGALMAGAACKVTGKVSVSISIKGPGLANMYPGILSNHYEGNPALSVSEAFGAEVPSHRQHKRLDHAALLRPVVKGHACLDHIEERLDAFLRLAQAEVPGPVHLDLCSWGSDAKSATGVDARESNSCSSSRRDAFFQSIRIAKQPILVVGSLALRAGWRRRLESLRIPVFTTASAKGALDERLVHSAGVFTGDGKELAPEAHLFSSADLVLGIGLRNTEVVSPATFQSPVLLIEEVDDSLAGGFESDDLLIDSRPALISTVLDELQERHWGLDELGILKRRMRESLLSEAWLPARCFDVVNGLKFSHAMVLDTGAFCTIGEHVWLAGPDRLFMGSSNGRFMGISIPSAIGVAVSKPELPVICVLGDGGIRMYPAEIRMAVHENLPICFVLMTDGRYGSVICVPQTEAKSSRAVTVSQPSWIRSVEAMGCEAHPVDSETSFAAVVKNWARTSPLFIEAAFDPEAYTTMTYRLR